MALEKEDARLIAEALNKLTSKGGGSAASAPKVDASIFAAPAQVFTGTIEAAGKGLTTLNDAYNLIAKEMAAGLGTWRQLSNSGITFGNDVIMMGAAAAGTRMDLGEFADMVGKNSVYLAGFGGSINQGAVEFAKTSKVMFDQYGETTDQLRQMGITNKDLNDTLALQAGMIGNSMRQGKERDKLAIDSATALAQEMDLTAKLTGKSRQEQMEGAKKLQADAAFNIKIEQATRNMGEVEAAKYRTQVTGEFAKAEAMGLGQSFKETFAYGQVMSKTAANEQVMAGRAGIESSRAAQATAAGNFEEASKRNMAAFTESAKNNKDASFQNVAMLDKFGGAAGENSARLYMVNKALADNFEKLKKDPGNAGKTDEELFLMAKDNAKKEQDARQAGTTAAMVNTEQRFKDAGSVIQQSLVLPIKEKVEPAFRALADTVLSTRSSLIPGARDSKDPSKNNISATEGEFEKGREQYNNKENPRGTVNTALGHSFGAVLNTVGTAANKAADVMDPKKEPRSGGTYGAGKMFEDVGAILEITKPGEVVLNGEQQMNLAKGMMDKGAASAFTNLSKNIDLSSISKDISTSISSISGGRETAVKGPDMKELSMSMSKMSLNDNQKKIFDEMMSLTSIQSKEKLQSLIAEKEAAQLTNVAAAKARDAIEERLEAEGKGIKDLVGADKERFDELTKQMNSSADAQDKVKEAIKAAERAEQSRLNLQKMGYDIGVNQEAEKVKIIEENAEKIKADISNALPVKDIAAKVAESKTVLSDHQKTVLKYAYEDAEGKQMQLDNQKNRIRGELNGIAEKNKSIEDIQKSADGRELTQREKNRIDRLQKEIESNKESLKFREEELFVYENLDKLKTESAEKTASILEEKTEKINNDIKSAIPIDEFAADPNMLDANAEPANFDAYYNQEPKDGERFNVEEAKQIPTRSDALKTAVNDASPTKLNRGITMDSFTLGANGLPIAKPKSIAAAVPDKPAEKKASPGKAINPETGEEYTPIGNAPAANKSADKKPAASSDKAATLDDVVKSLNALNTKMGQLISTTESGSRDVAKAAKSGSNNVYAR
jgi:hypothetical protein